MATEVHEPKISVIEVVKSFGDKRVLDGINLEVMPGESVVVVGGSGAGKTVLIKHMIGLLQPDSGRVVMDGVDLATASPQAALEVRKRCGMSFQEGALFDSMNVFDNVAFPIRRHRRDVGPPAVAARVRECLGLVRLAGIEGKMPAELSGGMLKRAAIARALALGSHILLLDEPSAGLDPITGANLDRTILSLRDNLGLTFVVVTHELQSIYAIADRAVMLDPKSRSIIAEGKPAVLRDTSTIPLVKQFFNRGADASHAAPGG